MSADYWIGIATLPALGLAVWVVALIAHWLAWWRETEHLARKGIEHEFDHMVHTHWWPHDTPWWLIRRFEPLRVRLCLRNSERPGGGA